MENKPAKNDHSEIIFKAIRLVAEAHDGQLRKGSRLPYITHLMNVMKILIDQDCDDEIVAAGILHDTLEDTPVVMEDIEKLFGPRVAFLVTGASEVREPADAYNGKASWKARKEHTIHFLLHDATKDQLLVCCADKLDNITAIEADYKRFGELLWQRFNAGKEQQQWYYTAIASAFAYRAKELGDPLSNLSDQFSTTVKEIFQ